MKLVESSPKGMESTVGKGEIARYEQFSFSHSVFKRLVMQTRKNQGLFGKGLKLEILLGWVENIARKGENAGIVIIIITPL